MSPARTRPAASVLSKSFQSSSCFTLAGWELRVAAGINALIWPATSFLAAGGSAIAGRETISEQSTIAVERLKKLIRDSLYRFVSIRWRSVIQV